MEERSILIECSGFIPIYTETRMINLLTLENMRVTITIRVYTDTIIDKMIKVSIFRFADIFILIYV